MDARTFNEWLSKRREGEDYADAMGRMTEAVNRRVPQLRWAGAERAQVLRAGDQLVRNSQDSGVVPGLRPRPPRPPRPGSRNTLTSGVVGGVARTQKESHAGAARAGLPQAPGLRGGAGLLFTFTRSRKSALRQVSWASLAGPVDRSPHALRPSSEAVHGRPEEPSTMYKWPKH